MLILDKLKGWCIERRWVAACVYEGRHHAVEADISNGENDLHTAALNLSGVRKSTAVH